MILCSDFLWFCDVESDVTHRDLSPNHSLVGGSSTATPVPVNLQKIQDERRVLLTPPPSSAQQPLTDTLSSCPGVQPSCRALPVHLTPNPCFKDKALPWSLAPACRARQEPGWAPLQGSELRESRFLSLCCSAKIKSSHPVCNC